MALLVPFPRTSRIERNFTGRPTTTWGTVLTASATPHSLGTKSVLVASTTYDADWILLTFSEMSSSATVTDGLVNIYIGGAGVEDVIIPNLLVGWSQLVASTGPGIGYAFPIRIPRGTRITADLRALIASDTCQVRMTLVAARGGWAGSGVETLGALTASSRGTQVTPGTISDGTFTAIGTSGRDYRYVLGRFIGNTDTTQVVSITSLDIGVGSALIPGLENFYDTCTSGEIFVPDPADMGRWVQIPSGTALQARLQSHTTDAENKSVCIYGVY